MNRMILTETFPATFTITEGKAGGPIRVKCPTMSITDEINSNDRVYPHAIWSREIGKLQEKIRASSLVGALDHPENGKSKISGAAIKWETILMEGKVTRGEGVIVPTQSGQDLAALLRSGVTVGISSRGFGSTLERMIGGRRAQVVQEDFELSTFDCVLDPSVRSAALQLAESQQRKELTQEQRRMQQLAGVATLDEHYPFFADQSDGVTHQSNLDVDHQRHAVSKPPMEKTPDFRDRLAAAVLAQKKLKVHVLAPASEDSWTCYNTETQRVILVTFTQTADEKITVTNITDNVDVRRVAEAYEVLRQQLFEAEFNDPDLRLRQQVLAGIR